MNKNWYKSKTMWTAVVGAGLSIVVAMGYAIPEYVWTILASLGLGFLRTSIK